MELLQVLMKKLFFLQVSESVKVKVERSAIRMCFLKEAKVFRVIFSTY